MRTLLMVLLAAWPTVLVRAQAAPPKAAAAPPAAVTPAKPGEAEPADPYAYETDGRRDPFLNLLGIGLEPRTAKHGGDGPASMSVNEVSVRGVMQSRNELIAMVQGPDSRTYIVHQGDKFVDGTIKSITAQGLVVVQEVNDPLSLVKQREVRKMLRSVEGPKE